ncbi:hypothetical protein AB0N65_19695 [Paenarthrobacter sp. NPDC089322]|uniref:hypothetical protein n=1 Tax=Paenarthrobacter sp. NPDC089322 TaxID=3155065 RepID=UPI0034349F62
MSEHISPRGGIADEAAEQAVDRLLADAGFEEAGDVRTELLELRALAGTAPAPSAAVRALMAGDTGAAIRITTADGGSSSGAPTAVLTPVGGQAEGATAGAASRGSMDELAVRRGRKRRAGIAGLAVVVSLAGGATAAAATEGAIFQHLGAAIGSVVAPFSPGSGSPAQDRPAMPSEEPAGNGSAGQDVPAQPAPAPGATGPATVSPDAAKTNPGSDRIVSPKTPAGVDPQTPRDPGKAEPGNVAIPTPPVTAPGIDPANPAHPNVTPPTLGPSGAPVPVPTHLIPDPAK